MLLRCLKCGARLAVEADRCVCPGCAAWWPVVDGIPRFLQAPAYYWGELSRGEARDLLDAARKAPWADAVRARFPEGDNMRYGLLDGQRASWLPMLGLMENAVALDVGCGYGAITHAISRAVGEVYAVEPIPERLEFTQERLRQEGIANVRLIQASALALPLVEKTFDLVILNGVLEWVGEWQTEGHPREVQLQFLATLRQLLEDDGVLLIGIENRIGYGLFLGRGDHSGIPYTSLVPRPVASFLLRRSSRPHHRTVLNPRREYRTYTYSERGYRRLLADAGFPEVSCHWADPGYNQPYHLIPTEVPQTVREQFRDLVDHPASAPASGWRRRLKRGLAASRWLTPVLPEFIFVAAKQHGRITGVGRWLEELLGAAAQAEGRAIDPRHLAWALYTHPFARKSVVRLMNRDTARDLAFVKLEVGGSKGDSPPPVEISNLTKVHDQLQRTAAKGVSVPDFLGARRTATATYSLESAARGLKLSRMVRRPGYFADFRRVERDFRRIVEGALELTQALKGLGGLKEIGWRDVPEELAATPELGRKIEAARCGLPAADHREGWPQHGDLSVENIFFDPRTGHIEIIDWDNLAAGWPPLYDLFSLFYSTGYLAPADERRRFRSEEDRWLATFEALFIKDLPFSHLVCDLMTMACQRLRLFPDRLPALLVEFLIVRAHYYRAHSAVQHRAHLRLLERWFNGGDRGLFGRLPVASPARPA